MTDDALDAAIGRIETITADASDPGACNLVEFLHEGDTLKDLHSDSTPIITKGIYILLPDENINVDVINVDLPTEPAKKKQKTCAFKAMMGKDYKFVEYLRYETDLDEEACIDTQILHYLYDYLEEIKLGYRDEKQKNKLMTNIQKIKNTLCFVLKYWKVLLRAEFPTLPDNQFSSSKFISALTGMKRMGTK